MTSWATYHGMKEKDYGVVYLAPPLSEALASVWAIWYTHYYFPNKCELHYSDWKQSVRKAGLQPTLDT